MNELLKPKTSPQGREIISAKNLHIFLEIKKDYSDWIKHRIQKYGFVENTDYVVFPQVGENLNGGRPSMEYGLTIEMAKELSMVEGNAKGKEARQYFIQCENELRASQSTTIASVNPFDIIQLMLDQAKAQDKRLSAVEQDVQIMKEDRNKATEELLLVERSTELVPEETTRMKIRKIINQYCHSKGADPQSVYRVVYDRLYYRYGVSIRSVVQKKNESLLDVAERLGHLDKIYAICSSEFV